jgi:hypothetical protein
LLIWSRHGQPREFRKAFVYSNAGAERSKGDVFD